MKDKIKSFKELHDELEDYRGNLLWLFRDIVIKIGLVAKIEYD
ncbi:hypothetical protein [Mammaliicoccus sciuri]|nr:hypothetical protein [Mammaliicoccus sciuri]